MARQFHQLDGEPGHRADRIVHGLMRAGHGDYRAVVERVAMDVEQAFGRCGGDARDNGEVAAFADVGYAFQHGATMPTAVRTDERCQRSGNYLTCLDPRTSPLTKQPSTLAL
jgi:hypothetical protein